MTDYTDPTRSTLRLSDAEREVAVRELSAAQAAGRLSPEEFTERSTAARQAVTRGDLAPLFRDLPGSDAPSSVPYTSATAAASTTRSSAQADDASATWAEHTPRPGRRPLGGAAGATVMALIPFIALILFFVSAGIWGWAWAWLWFLLIPIAGLVIYGPYGDGDKRK